jgi:hypothetical protein
MFNEEKIHINCYELKQDPPVSSLIFRIDKAPPGDFLTCCKCKSLKEILVGGEYCRGCWDYGYWTRYYDNPDRLPTGCKHLDPPPRQEKTPSFLVFLDYL